MQISKDLLIILTFYTFGLINKTKIVTSLSVNTFIRHFDLIILITYFFVFFFVKSAQVIKVSLILLHQLFEAHMLHFGFGIEANESTNATF